MHGLVETLAGGAAGFILMLGLYYLGVLFSRWIGKRRGKAIDEEALGFGDVNLSGILGLLLGWPGILAGLIIAVMLGGAVSLIYLVYMLVTRQYKLFTPIPYGPFLVLSAVSLLYFKNTLF
jgi:leader peptidase (prepilin peptidase)/N-methyltransferase